MVKLFSAFYKLLFLVLFLGSFLLACSSNGNEKKKPTQPVEHLDPASAPLYPAENMAQAKDFQVTLIDGSSFRLSEQQGKVVLMNIWATWCAPCHAETPEFVDLYSRFQDQGLEILGVSIDEQGESVVKPFMEKYEVNYPMVIDDGRIMDKYGPTMAIPTTYIIGKQGELRFFAVGAVTLKELEPRLKALLNE